MLGRRVSRGDTLVEVLFAVTVFSFVVVGALSIMNQGTAASQRSLEITLVRQQIDAQAEVLRFTHDSYVAEYRTGISYDTTDTETSPAEEWWRMTTSGFSATSASPFGSTSDGCPTPPTGSFIMDPRNVRFMPGTGSNLQPSVTYAQVTHTATGAFSAAQGLWIEPIRAANNFDSDQSSTGFIDFHIRACWEAPGTSAPLTTGTIVRLYEPRN